MNFVGILGMKIRSKVADTQIGQDAQATMLQIFILIWAVMLRFQIFRSANPFLRTIPHVKCFQCKRVYAYIVRSP
jgi:hypothetical protein